jgi:hypothetical protein
MIWPVLSCVSSQRGARPSSATAMASRRWIGAPQALQRQLAVPPARSAAPRSPPRRRRSARSGCWRPAGCRRRHTAVTSGRTRQSSRASSRQAGASTRLLRSSSNRLPSQVRSVARVRTSVSSADSPAVALQTGAWAGRLPVNCGAVRAAVHPGVGDRQGRAQGHRPDLALGPALQAHGVDPSGVPALAQHASRPGRSRLREGRRARRRW